MQRTPEAQWHRVRGKAILTAHPEIKTLHGRDRTTAVVAVFLLVAHFGVALAVAHLPWWALFVVTYVVGWLLFRNLDFLAHECVHNLIFKKKEHNRWLFTMVTFSLFVPNYYKYGPSHHQHHYEMGSEDDGVRRRREWFMRRHPLTPFFSPLPQIMDFYFALLDAAKDVPGLVRIAVFDKPGRCDRRVATFGLWFLFFFVTNIVLWAVLGGGKPMAYLALSALFGSGFLHPLCFGMRLHIAHIHAPRGGEETPSYSYYGFLNKLTLNWGIHTEHHDLPGIPLFRLPEVRRMAPEFYDKGITKSYIGLCFTLHTETFKEYWDRRKRPARPNAPDLRGVRLNGIGI